MPRNGRRVAVFYLRRNGFVELRMSNLNWCSIERGSSIFDQSKFKFQELPTNSLKSSQEFEFFMSPSFLVVMKPFKESS